MKKILRFMYLNTYGFLLVFFGILVLAVPFWKINIYIIIGQIALAAYPLIFGIILLSGWKDKKREYIVLMARNRKNFRHDTFEIYMGYPCGRKMTKAVLKDLNKSEEYKNLLCYKQSFKEEIISCFKKPEAKLTYVNTEYIAQIKAEAASRGKNIPNSAVFKVKDNNRQI